MNLPAFSSESSPEQGDNVTPTGAHHAGKRRGGISSVLAFKSKPFLVTPMRQTRILAMLGFFLGWTLLIVGRLTWVQLIQHSEWAERAERQQQRTFTVAPRRGILYDRNVHELAMTVVAQSIYAVPSEIGDQRSSDAATLAKIVHTDPEDRFTSEKQILARLTASRNFAWVARKEPPAIIAKVEALKLKGIYFQKEFKRFYPDQVLAAQMLGYVGMDDDGLAGIEQERDKELHGTPGRMLTAIDARRHVLDSQERDPQPGENLVLTIDSNIQFMAEQALDRNMERTGAANGTVVVQDPHTGQILALAIRPTFDPNNFRHTDRSLLKDHAVSDVYEPGSTFKLVTYSAALDQGVVKPEDMIDCEGGKIVVAGRAVHDDHYNGVMTVTQALEVSSDVAAIKLGMRMGPERFYQYIHGYGFGLRSGIELPGETRGLVKPPSRWQPTTIGSIPMGQEIAVTPIQLVTMASAIANGGVYLPPHIVLKGTGEMRGNPDLRPATFHPEGELPDPLPQGAHRVISEMTSAEMRKMMEDVVLYGTGTTAQLNGYSAAGKTGTAQKIDPVTRTYSHTKYVASFVGFAPVSDPAVTIAVIMDSPTKGNHFGHEVSAPVFQDLAQQVLEYLGVQHDQDLKPVKELAKKSKPVKEADPEEHAEDLQSLFAEVNDLPADDPLRNPENQGPAPADVAVAQGSEPAQSPASASKTNAPAPVEAGSSEPVGRPSDRSNAAHSSVTVAVQQVAVPSFAGKSLREVVERASSVGLGVQIVGSGIARDQAPAAGTLVPAGTEIVVRFAQ